MHLLLTRPEPDNAKSATRLRALGHEVHLFPVLSVAYHAPPRLDVRPDALAVTSRNGARALARWPEAEGWRDLPVFAVGDATADLAREHGFRQVVSAGGDLHALAALIASRAHDDAKLIDSAAQERTGDLGTLLSGTGWHVTTVDAYHMEAVAALDAETVRLLTDGVLDGALVYSARSAAALVSLLEAQGQSHLLETWWLGVLSPAVAAPLRAAGAQNLHVAPQPDEASLISLL